MKSCFHNKIINYQKKKSNIIIDIDYFGFLLSFQLKKEGYPYNEKIIKDSRNHLRTDIIVKCDDLIKMNESEIEFKIGEIKKEDLQRFIKTFEQYLDENKI